MNRQMMIVFVDTDHHSDVEQIFEEYETMGYSVIPEILGKGVTGRKFGNRAFPGSSTCYIAVVSDQCASDIAGRLRGLVAEKGIEEGLKVYSLPVDEVI